MQVKPFTVQSFLIPFLFRNMTLIYFLISLFCDFMFRIFVRTINYGHNFHGSGIPTKIQIDNTFLEMHSHYHSIRRISFISDVLINLDYRLKNEQHCSFLGF